MAITIIKLASLDANDGFRLEGEAENDWSGYATSAAGDVNNDGFDDVIVGAPFADQNGSYSGSSYVVFGQVAGLSARLNLSSLDGVNGFRLDGELPDDHSGGSVSSAGDVNGDGFDDVIVGASEADKNGQYSGSSYVVFGKASGFNASLNLSSLDGNNGFRIDGESIYDHSGRSVSNAGDINGDGFDDVIIGAAKADPNGYRSGSSYVVFGKAFGFDASLNLSSLNGSNGFRIDGESIYDYSGWSISNAGDVDGDGFDDLIVGAPNVDSNDHYSGSSYVVFGKSTGFSATINLSSLDGINGFRIDGLTAYDFVGNSVSSAGDLNGDGFDDVIVGARSDDLYSDSSDSSYVIFGKSTRFDADFDLSSVDGKNGFRLLGEAHGDYFGHSISDAGDVNGDGFDDLIIGAEGADPNGEGSGSSYVIFGKASGFSAMMDLTSLEINDGFRVDGEASGDYSGKSVSAAGDVNGDGFDDLMIGAFKADLNRDNSGTSYILFGRSDFSIDGLLEIVGTRANDQLSGTFTAEYFKAGAGNDRMIGRGGADEFHGEAGDDHIQVLDLGFGLINGGTGNDVLHTDGKDLKLDLTDYLDKIHNIETICLYGRGDNMLTLTGAELKALSDTTDTLKVHGNAGDQVILEGNWVDGGSHGFYHTYTQDDAVLLVGINMAAVLA